MIPSVSGVATLTAPAALHVQLSERFLERRLDRGDFFGAEIFLHRRLGTRDGGFRRGFVDDRGLERHVSQDGDRRASHLDEAFADGEKSFLAALQNSKFTRVQSCQK